MQSGSIRVLVLMFLTLTMVLGWPIHQACADETALPRPSLDGSVSVEKALASRVTARSYSSAPLTLAQVGQILWAGNGNIPTDAVSAATKKVIPSARKTYPIELYLVCGEGTVEKLPAGVYHYNADRHALQRIVDGDRRKPMSSACKGQSWIASAPVSVIVGSVLARAEATSGSERGINFGVMEAGNANQNILLQALALGFETNTVGGIRDAELSEALKLPQDVRPIVLVTVGKKS
ncbi:MAG: SagB/ThcOx family dehydrogenase [Desulfomonilaceae bacterium]